MNERIKELAVQADFMLCTDGRFYSEGRYLDITLELEKFAELVIKDCLGACIADVADPRDTVELKCAKKIKASWDDESWDKPAWVQLTFDDFPEAEFGNTDFLAGARWAANKLKEKNT
jgi:hypothetical protein